MLDVFFNDTATTEIYTLSLHDALPIYPRAARAAGRGPRPGRPRAGTERECQAQERPHARDARRLGRVRRLRGECRDRKSTRLNSSHANISYAVFCLKKKKSTTSRSAS